MSEIEKKRKKLFYLYCGLSFLGFLVISGLIGNGAQPSLVLGGLFLFGFGYMAWKYRSGVPTADTHVKCPDCKELVKKEASVCPHCQCKLIPQ
jgi:hypothetical protein